MNKKIAIKYGIGEGDYHGRAFVAALKVAGFEVVRDAREADIVVTHSGGCFFLPPLDLNQIFVVINPPYWPGKSLSRSTIEKVSKDFMDFAKDGKLLPWFWKSTINILHLMRYIFRTLTITLHAHKQRFYEALRDETSVIIRNDNDTFLAPNADQLLEQKVGRVIDIYRLPGQHDSCWRDPRQYIEIIKQVATKTRKTRI
jgi:hypothetical protein